MNFVRLFCKYFGCKYPMQLSSRYSQSEIDFSPKQSARRLQSVARVATQGVQSMPVKHDLVQGTFFSGLKTPDVGLAC